MSQGVRRAALADETWREGEGMSTYRLNRTGKIIHPELGQTACETSGCGWLCGRTLRTFDYSGRKIWV